MIDNVAICICDTFANNNIVTGGNLNQRKKKTGADSVMLTMQNIENVMSQNPDLEPSQIFIGCTGTMVPEVELLSNKFEGITIKNDPNNYGMQKGSAVGYQLAIKAAIENPDTKYIICFHGDIFVDTLDWISKLSSKKSTILLPKWYGRKELYSNDALDTKFFAGTKRLISRVLNMDVPPLQIGDPNLRQNDVEHHLAKAMAIQYTITHQELNHLGIYIYHSHHLDWEQNGELIADCP